MIGENKDRDKLETNLMAIMADCLRQSVQEPLAVESVDALLAYIGSHFDAERIELFVPIDLKCPEHKLYPMDLFCANDKGNISNIFIIYYFLI